MLTITDELSVSFFSNNNKNPILYSTEIHRYTNCLSNFIGMVKLKGFGICENKPWT